METRYCCVNCNTKLFNPQHLICEESDVLVFSKPVTPDSVYLSLETEKGSSLQTKTKVLCDSCGSHVGYLDMKTKKGMSFPVFKESLILS